MNKDIIFDMDGTLLDSMPVWENLGSMYLKSCGAEPEKGLSKIIEMMTLEESAAYFKDTYLPQKNVDEIKKGILLFIQGQYENVIPLKAGRKALLQQLSQSGATMCILTTSDEHCARAALERLGVYQYFQRILTSEELNLSKRTPQIYLKTCSEMGFRPENKTVYEDGLTQVKMAKTAGCRVIAAFDESSRKDWNEIMQFADEILEPLN